MKKTGITRKQAIKKMGKYAALTAIGTFAILNPKKAQAQSLRMVLQRQNEEIYHLKPKEMELNQVKQEKERYVVANHRQRARTVVLQRDIETLRNERESTQAQNQSLIQEVNKLKVKHVINSFDFASVVLIICCYLNKWKTNG